MLPSPKPWERRTLSRSRLSACCRPSDSRTSGPGERRPVMSASVGLPPFLLLARDTNQRRRQGSKSDFVAQQSQAENPASGVDRSIPGDGPLDPWRRSLHPWRWTPSTSGVDRSIPGGGHHRPLASIAPSPGMGTIDPWRRSLRPWDGHRRPLASIAPSLVMDTIDPLASIAPSWAWVRSARGGRTNEAPDSAG